MRLHTTSKGGRKLCPRQEVEFKREFMEENVLKLSVKTERVQFQRNGKNIAKLKAEACSQEAISSQVAVIDEACTY